MPSNKKKGKKNKKDKSELPPESAKVSVLDSETSIQRAVSEILSLPGILIPFISRGNRIDNKYGKEYLQSVRKAYTFLTSQPSINNDVAKKLLEDSLKKYHVELESLIISLYDDVDFEEKANDYLRNSESVGLPVKQIEAKINVLIKEKNEKKKELRLRKKEKQMEKAKLQEEKSKERGVDPDKVAYHLLMEEQKEQEAKRIEVEEKRIKSIKVADTNRKRSEEEKAKKLSMEETIETEKKEKADKKALAASQEARLKQLHEQRLQQMKEDREFNKKEDEKWKRTQLEEMKKDEEAVKLAKKAAEDIEKKQVRHKEEETKKWEDYWENVRKTSTFTPLIPVYLWNDLTSEERDAANVLGWDEYSWNQGESPGSSSKLWTELTPDEQGAATLLDYNEDVWNEKIFNEKERALQNKDLGATRPRRRRGYRSSSNIARNNYKTKLCKYFMEGRCQFGEHCTYAHGIHELRGPRGLRSDATEFVPQAQRGLRPGAQEFVPQASGTREEDDTLPLPSELQKSSDEDKTGGRFKKGKSKRKSIKKSRKSIKKTKRKSRKKF